MCLFDIISQEDEVTRDSKISNGIIQLLHI